MEDLHGCAAISRLTIVLLSMVSSQRIQGAPLTLFNDKRFLNEARYSPLIRQMRKLFSRSKIYLVAKQLKSKQFHNYQQNQKPDKIPLQTNCDLN